MNRVFRFSKICMFAQVILGFDLAMMLSAINISSDEPLKMIVVNSSFAIAAFLILSPLITFTSKFTISDTSIHYTNPILRINKILNFSDVEKVTMRVGWGSFIFVLIDKKGKKFNLNYFTSGYRSIVELVMSKCAPSAEIDPRIANCIKTDIKLPHVLLLLSIIILVLLLI